MDGRIELLGRSRADTVDADVETPQVAQLDFLSGQQLLPHAIHGHGEDGNDIRTLVHAAMTGYMLGKAVDVHHFRILRTCVRFFGNRLIGRIATHHDTVVNHKLKIIS